MALCRPQSGFARTALLARPEGVTARLRVRLGVSPGSGNVSDGSVFGCQGPPDANASQGPIAEFYRQNEKKSCKLFVNDALREEILVTSLRFPHGPARLPAAFPRSDDGLCAFSVSLTGTLLVLTGPKMRNGFKNLAE